LELAVSGKGYFIFWPSNNFPSMVYSFVMISIPKILILAMVQGAAELLPVSSSAHVIVAEKLMGLDPTLPAMTLLLVMLHTGTMLAVIVYFWSSWKQNFFSSKEALGETIKSIVLATVATEVPRMRKSRCSLVTCS
jgi:undecaprenyl pyrophosphate phosphatase UppP